MKVRDLDFKQQKDLIERTIRFLCTKEDIYDDNHCKIKASTLINRSIQLDIFNLDMSIVLLAKALKSFELYRIDQLLCQNKDVNSDLVKKLFIDFDCNGIRINKYTQDARVRLREIHEYKISTGSIIYGYEQKSYIDTFQLFFRRDEEYPNITDEEFKNMFNIPGSPYGKQVKTETGGIVWPPATSIYYKGVNYD